MGLINDMLRKGMIIKWTSEDRANRDVAPGYYLAMDINYKNPVPKTKAEVSHERDSSVLSMVNMFGSFPSDSKMISGAIALDYYLNYTPPTSHSNLDMIFMPDLDFLEAHFKAAKQDNMFPMWRSSGKLYKSSPTKYHVYHPAQAWELLGSREAIQRNPELTRINPGANMIESEFSSANHIRIYLHQQVKDGVTCVEDKKPIVYPEEFLRGVPFTIKGEKVFLVDPRYMHLKLKSVVANKEHNYQRHLSHLTKLEVFLRDNASDFPIKGFNC